MNMNQNQLKAFKMASEIERKYIKEFHETHQEFDVWKVTSTTGYSTFDCFVISGRTYEYTKDVFRDNRWAVEVKIRTYTKQQVDSAYIKCYKWYQMINKCNTPKYKLKNVQPIYMMFFSCGTVAIWNLFEARKKYIEKVFKQHNCIDDSNIISNKLFELSFDDATFYKWK